MGSRSWYPQFQRWGSSPCSIPPNASVPGPCDPEDLLDGVIFGAKYLGSTQLASERNPPTSVRMAQAQEAVDRIKVQEGWRAWPPVGVGQCSRSTWGTWLWSWVPAGSCDLSVVLQAPEGESQPMTEVDLFVSTQRIKVLTADTQVSRNSSNHVALWLLQHSCLVSGSQLCSHTSRVLPRIGLQMGTHLGGDVSLHSHPVSCPCLSVAAQGFPSDLRPVELLGNPGLKSGELFASGLVSAL